MIALRALGRDLQKVHLQREIGLVRDARSIFNRLQRDMMAVAEEWLDAMVVNGQINYKLWDRWQRSFVNALHRSIKDAYDDLAALAITAQKTAFDTANTAIVDEFKTLYPMVKIEKTDKEPKPLTFIDKSLEALHAECCAELVESGVGHEQAEAQSWASVTGWSSIEEARIPVLQVGKGKVTPEYLQFLRDQTRSDIAPGSLIKTISADQLKVVQRTLVSSMEKGKDLRWTKDKIVKELAAGWTDEKEKSKLDYNVMRIIRTSHNRAANAGLAYFAARNPMVAEMERVADGRPCAACLLADGTRIPRGQIFIDHPNGMCLLTPVVKSLEELGYDYGTLPESAKKAWTRQQRPHPPMKMEFYELPEKDQRIVLGNSIYELWKQERFPLEALVIRTKGWLSPMTFKDLQARVNTLGGMSAPKASIALADGTIRILTAADRAITFPLDPVDRANLSAVIWQGPTPQVLGQYQQDLFGMGVDGYVPDSVRAEAEDWLFSVGKLPNDPTFRAQVIAGAKWQEFNEYARVLGLYTRKGTDGKFYHVVPKGQQFNKAMRLVNKAP